MVSAIINMIAAEVTIVLRMTLLIVLGAVTLALAVDAARRCAGRGRGLLGGDDDDDRWRSKT